MLERICITIYALPALATSDKSWSFLRGMWKCGFEEPLQLHLSNNVCEELTDLVVPHAKRRIWCISIVLGETFVFRYLMK